MSSALPRCKTWQGVPKGKIITWEPTSSSEATPDQGRLKMNIQISHVLKWRRGRLLSHYET